MSWSEFLAYLSQPNGIAAVVGALLSVVTEYIPGYDPLPPKWKRAVFFGMCFIVPLVGVALGILTASWPVDFEATFWPALVAGFLAFSTGTLTHIRKL